VPCGCCSALGLPQGDADLSSADAKPTYHDVLVYVTQIKEDQTMYYLANPDGGKKVVRVLVQLGTGDCFTRSRASLLIVAEATHRLLQ
jgi:hypothetical protein